MSAKFYTLLTEIGAAKLASAAALGVPLKITKMAVGDGGGVLPTPSAQQTALIAEKRRADLNMLYIDPQNSSQIIAEQVIPETEGGWWIREVGLFDETGALIAVGNCPESYKPQLSEGSGRTQTVRMVLITSSTDNITLKIDPAVVLATRKYVDDKVLELKLYVDSQMKAHLEDKNPHSQYPLIANALKELADAGIADKAIKNLGLSGGVATGAVGRLVGVTVVKTSQLYAKNPATKFAVVEVQGGGGAGGGSTSVTANSTCSLGGGGTNGAYAKVVVLNPADKTPIAIGSGGAAVSAATGNSGGATSFGSITAPGGFGGNSMSANSVPAVAGTNGANTVVDPSGADIVLISTPVLQPGILGLRLSGTVGVSGAGGRSAFGDGGYARAAPDLSGIDGKAYGSGGGGSYSGITAGSPALAGGNGAQGVVVIWEYA